MGICFCSISAYHCFNCKKVFGFLANLRRHLKNPKNHVYCGESTHDHDLVDERFADMSEAKAWVQNKELDKTFSIASSTSDYALYYCRHRRSRASKQKSDNAKRRKVTPKPVYSCHAQFSIAKTTVCNCDSSEEGFECNNTRVVFQLRGCTTHSHDFEIRHHRISKITRDFAVNLLKNGVPKATILEKYCSLDEYDNLDHKLITMQDLINFERLYVDLAIDKKKSDFENLCNLLELEALRACSFEGRAHPPIPTTIKKKIISTGGKSTIIYASNAMLERFEKNPSTLFMDGTHGTNRSKFILITLMVKGKLSRTFLICDNTCDFHEYTLISDARGEGVPVFQIIAESESAEVLKPAFKVLNELAPEAVKKVKVLMSDLAGAFPKAWQESFPNSDCRVVKCAWHLENAWKRQLLPQNAELYQCLRRLRKIPDENDFWIHFYKLKHD